MLEQIELPPSIDKMPVSSQIIGWIRDAQRRIEAFQDCWKKPQIEQFVAADYLLVYQTLAWLLESQPRRGNRFLEWGCGFAVVTALASTLDLDAIGMEAEGDLLAQGRNTIELWDVDVELVHGDFLPMGAETLADDPTLPSLGHGLTGGYEQLGMDLDDFAIVYAYPWPGEDDFHEAVFDRHAAIGALLLLFCGPNEMRLWRKVS
jgi:hypothetical protein